jgi:hypothetical protein
MAFPCPSTCGWCGVQDAEYRCFCKVISYCCKQCQKDDWKTHEIGCYQHQQLQLEAASCSDEEQIELLDRVLSLATLRDDIPRRLSYTIRLMDAIKRRRPRLPTDLLRRANLRSNYANLLLT